MKKTLYPKTKRIGNTLHKVTVTEKLDGSNIGFFRQGDELLIAQRNNIYKLSDVDSKSLYKGLAGWLQEHGNDLKDKIRDGSGFFGEWIGMGKLGYGGSDIDTRLYMFAKANIDEELNAYNILYNHELFKYPFTDCEIPDYIKVVPVVNTYDLPPNVQDLNELYQDYTTLIGRKVEGFVVALTDKHIVKYVRMKNGTLSAHKS